MPQLANSLHVCNEMTWASPKFSYSEVYITCIVLQDPSSPGSNSLPSAASVLTQVNCILFILSTRHCTTPIYPQAPPSDHAPRPPPSKRPSTPSSKPDKPHSNSLSLRPNSVGPSNGPMQASSPSNGPRPPLSMCMYP